MRIIPILCPLVCWFLTGCSQPVRPRPRHVTDGSVKITDIDKAHVFDLSGYADDGESDPFNLFDENSFVNPRDDNGDNPFIPKTNPQPKKNPAIYFDGVNGNRIVADLQHSYKITEVYLYDQSDNSDSVWIYTGNMRHWTLKAGFPSGAAGGNGWRRFSIDDSSRFLMIRFSSYETAITEMVAYGKPLRDSMLQIPVSAPAPAFTHHTLDHFVGVNYIMESEARWLKPFHYSRLYKFSLDFDNDQTHAWPDISFNMLHYGYWNTGINKYVFDIDTLQKINQGNLWYSLRGVAGWLNAKGVSEHERPVNLPGMDPNDPASYARHAEMMWHIAAFYGHQQVDTNLMSLSHEPRQSGRGTMSMYENGNEENASWIGKYYCTPTAYFAQSTADLDGDEGRQGKRFGISQADPAARLMMSGLTGLDTGRVKVYKFLSDQLRDDRRFPWQAGIQYHYYCGRDGRGISPEADSLRSKLRAVRSASWKIQPGTDCFLGENGYDKNPASRQCTPMLPGQTAAQSQGIMLLRSLNATFFSGFDAYIIYWLRDTEGENSPNVYMSSGLIYKDAQGQFHGYPAWYYISSLVSVLGTYRPDRIVQESGGVWIYKYRSATDPDQVAYFIYSPTTDGSRVHFRMPLHPKGTVSLMRFEDQTENGAVQPIPLVNGQVELSVEEKPQVLLLKE